MLAVASFDPLKLARKLESAGFPIKQAQDMAAAHAEAIADLQISADVATHEDVKKVSDDVLKARDDLRKVEKDVEKLEAKMEVRFAEVNQRIAEKANDTIRWVLGFLIAQTGVLIAIVKLHG